jgi:hypothetical protein
LFDDVGDVVLRGIPRGSHAFIVFGDVVGGPSAPFCGRFGQRSRQRYVQVGLGTLWREMP